jgi:hypothetical protein
MTLRFPICLIVVLLISASSVTAQSIDRAAAIRALEALPTINPPAPPPACMNGLDDDADGLVDLLDPGCERNPQKLSEVDTLPVPACVFTLSAPSASVGDGSSVGLVSLTVGPPLCQPPAWTATSAASWLTLSTASGTGSGQVGYTVASNTSTSPRTGVLTIAGQAFTVTQAAAPPPPPTSGDVVILDRFEYDSPRNATSDAAFRAAGWNNAKSHSWASAQRANGYLYTTTSIPGYTGPFPGGGARVLALEAKPGTLGGQTDFYLQLGNEGTDGKIPGDVWIQFWVYSQDHVASGQRSRHGMRNKFMYFARQTYPSHDHTYMLGATSAMFNPLNTFPGGFASTGFAISLASAEGGTTLRYEGPNADPYAANIIGPQHPAGYIPPNRWTLVKMHMTAAGTWEMWHRTLTTPWLKVADFRHGLNGLTWLVPAAQQGGHRMLRMPTTVGHATDHSQDFDYWLYLDDFVIARRESALPVYQ